MKHKDGDKFINNSAQNLNKHDKGRRKLEFVKKAKTLPLADKIIYLDVKDARQTRTLEGKVKHLGGIIEKFLVKEVNYVISCNVLTSLPRRADKGQTTADSPAAQSTPSPFNLGQSPSPGVPTDAKKETVSRGKAILQIAKKTSHSNHVVANAEKMGIKIVSLEAAVKWLEKELDKVKTVLPTSSSKELHKKKSGKRVERLKVPYVKFEAVSCQYRPIMHNLGVWPRVNTLTAAGTCPFDGRALGRPQQSERGDRDEACPGNILSPGTPHAQRDELSQSKTTKADGSTCRMFGVPIVTPGDIKREKERRRREARRRGYCECCKEKYDNIDKHLRGQEHKDFIKNKKNFDSLDRLIRKGPNTVKFLQRVLLRQCVNKATTRSSGTDDSKDGVALVNNPVGRTRLELAPEQLNAERKMNRRHKYETNAVPSDPTQVVKPHSADRSVPPRRAAPATPQKPCAASVSRGDGDEGSSSAVVVRRSASRGVHGSPQRPCSERVGREKTLVIRDSPIASLQTLRGEESGRTVADKICSPETKKRKSDVESKGSKVKRGRTNLHQTTEPTALRTSPRKCPQQTSQTTPRQSSPRKSVLCRSQSTEPKRFSPRKHSMFVPDIGNTRGRSAPPDREQKKQKPVQNKPKRFSPRKQFLPVATINIHKVTFPILGEEKQLVHHKPQRFSPRKPFLPGETMDIPRASSTVTGDERNALVEDDIDSITLQTERLNESENILTDHVTLPDHVRTKTSHIQKSDAVLSGDENDYQRTALQHLSPKVAEKHPSTPTAASTSKYKTLLLLDMLEKDSKISSAAKSDTDVGSRRCATTELDIIMEDGIEGGKVISKKKKWKKRIASTPRKKRTRKLEKLDESTCSQYSVTSSGNVSTMDATIQSTSPTYKKRATRGRDTTPTPDKESHCDASQSPVFKCRLKKISRNQTHLPSESITSLGELLEVPFIKTVKCRKESEVSIDSTTINYFDSRGRPKRSRKVVRASLNEDVMCGGDDERDHPFAFVDESEELVKCSTPLKETRSRRSRDVHVKCDGKDVDSKTNVSDIYVSDAKARSRSGQRNVKCDADLYKATETTQCGHPKSQKHADQRVVVSPNQNRLRSHRTAMCAAECIDSSKIPEKNRARPCAARGDADVCGSALGTAVTDKNSRKNVVLQSTRSPANKKKGQKVGKRKWLKSISESERPKRRVKLNRSWLLLSDRSLTRLLGSDGDQEPFMGFQNMAGGLPSDYTYQEVSEVDFSDNSRQEWVFEESEAVEAVHRRDPSGLDRSGSQDTGDDFEDKTWVASFLPSPDKASNSSWLDACDSFLETACKKRMNSYCSVPFVLPFLTHLANSPVKSNSWSLSDPDRCCTPSKTRVGRSPYRRTSCVDPTHAVVSPDVKHKTCSASRTPVRSPQPKSSPDQLDRTLVALELTPDKKRVKRSGTRIRSPCLRSSADELDRTLVASEVTPDKTCVKRGASRSRVQSPCSSCSLCRTSTDLSPRASPLRCSKITGDVCRSPRRRLGQAPVADVVSDSHTSAHRTKMKLLMKVSSNRKSIK